MPPFKLSRRAPNVRCGVQGYFAAAPPKPAPNQLFCLANFLFIMLEIQTRQTSKSCSAPCYLHANSDLSHIKPIEADFERPARSATIEHDGQYQEVSDGSRFIDAIVR
jgi:hypothetical protein